ncbi:S-methyl-5-thioribose-1-phosphate isomerase [Candidatus Bathyarchaeota archaeon]|nr:S-methyl-5-thioribose-1-phosphate isomerase [Candidatus Bathyarchaeota archaeon]
MGIDKIVDVAERIRRLEVQGATNIALTAVKALNEYVQESVFKDRASKLSEVSEARSVLSTSRETEPYMRNAIKYFEWKLRNANWETREGLREVSKKILDELILNFEKSHTAIISFGSKRILDGDCILTHCHSSTVNDMLKLAKRNGSSFSVIVTETRPLYQGRITARELIEAGIETTLIVDSAARSFIKSVDLVIVGADAITSEGNVINKIGTSMIALIAHEARIPFYTISSLLKFDPQTVYGEFESIEERNSFEVWADPPEGLCIANPAFDITKRDYIHGIICEEGVISPHSILEAVYRRYPWVFTTVDN